MYKIRPLRESDRADVLEIARHTWEGYDYLPYFFDSWLHDSNAYTAAIEQDGHVIALANLRVIDNGSTGWMEGLRVHPSYRGKGIASLLTEHVVQQAESLNLKRIRYTTAADNTTSFHLASKVGMEKKFELAVRWHNTPTIKSYHILNEPIERVSVDLLSVQLSTLDLLPHNIIVYDWKALEAIKDNLTKMASFCNFWVQIHEGTISSLSLGFLRDGTSGVQWHYTIYANNVSRFTDHLSHQLTLASKNNCRYTEGTFPVPFLESLNLVTSEEEDGVSLVLFEKDL